MCIVDIMLDFNFLSCNGYSYLRRIGFENRSCKCTQNLNYLEFYGAQIEVFNFS